MSKRALGTALAIVVVAVVGVLAVILMKGDNTPKASNNTNNSSSTNQNKSPQSVTTSSVTIKDFAFSPATITVKVGTKVTWTNQDAVGHTVTADSGSGPASQLTDQGQSYSYTFDKAGTFAYHCTPHPYMKGTVIVTE